MKQWFIRVAVGLASCLTITSLLFLHAREQQKRAQQLQNQAIEAPISETPAPAPLKETPNGYRTIVAMFAYYDHGTAQLLFFPKPDLYPGQKFTLPITKKEYFDLSIIYTFATRNIPPPDLSKSLKRIVESMEVEHVLVDTVSGICAARAFVHTKGAMQASPQALESVCLENVEMSALFVILNYQTNKKMPPFFARETLFEDSTQKKEPMTPI